MTRTYSVTSPSLDGLLRHDSLEYAGIKRPTLVSRIFDRPGQTDYVAPLDPEKQKIVEHYFNDLYNILIKRLSEFAIQSEPSAEEAVRLQAMLQEFIKVKKLLASKVVEA